jgi:DNA-binding transcriptional LysR family regulator
MSVNLVLLDRNANLIEEGIDVALRVAELPDSSMVAVRVGGDVRRVVVASPRYLALHPRIDEPGDLAKHRIVTTTHFGRDAWVFPPRGVPSSGSCSSSPGRSSTASARRSPRRSAGSA